jgi:ABC-type multidrug transport system fused ATPase/permease subunit
MREEYVAGLLRQEIAWFDEENVGETSTRITEDILKVKEGIGEKFGNGLHHLATFVTGFIVAFIYGWRLTLVLLCACPVMVITSAFVFKAITMLTTTSQDAYAKSGAIAEEVFRSIRTVTSFGGYLRESHRYGDHLTEAETAGVKQAKWVGMSMGSYFMATFGLYALAFWYGSVLVSDDATDALDKYPCTGSNVWECGCAHPDAVCISGGDILTTFFSVIIGAVALGGMVRECM